MATDLQDFHYMSVLRQLELEGDRLKGGPGGTTVRQPVNRLVQIFDVAKRKLAAVRVSQGEKISLNLKFSREGATAPTSGSDYKWV
jgi:hypothetical protein